MNELDRVEVFKACRAPKTVAELCTRFQAAPTKVLGFIQVELERKTLRSIVPSNSNPSWRYQTLKLGYDAIRDHEQGEKP